MNKIVGNMSDMLGRMLGEDVTLQLNYCPSPATVEADAGMMEQVLLNLAVNARDAMPRGGQLAVRIAIVDCERSSRATASRSARRAGSFASAKPTPAAAFRRKISRASSSRFSPPRKSARAPASAWPPFMALSNSIRAGSKWKAPSAKARTFRIYIPYAGKQQAETEKPTTQITIRGGTETILLVEDEKPVRELVARVLEKYGYKVLQAATGVEAVETLARTQRRYRPPAHRPRDARKYEWPRTRRNLVGRPRPTLKVIFTSGYSADIVGKDFKLEPELNYLQKPYQPQTLIAGGAPLP